VPRSTIAMNLKSEEKRVTMADRRWRITAAQNPPTGQIVEACWHPPDTVGCIIEDAVLDVDGSWRIISALMAVGMSAPKPGPPNFWRPQTRGPEIDGVFADKGF